MRNLTAEEVKNIFRVSVVELELTSDEVHSMSRRGISFASACGRNAIIAFCEANGLELPAGFPGTSNHELHNLQS
jgi:hypothetical protein